MKSDIGATEQVETLGIELERSLIHIDDNYGVEEQFLPIMCIIGFLAFLAGCAIELYVA